MERRLTRARMQIDTLIPSLMTREHGLERSRQSNCAQQTSRRPSRHSAAAQPKLPGAAALRVARAAWTIKSGAPARYAL